MRRTDAQIDRATWGTPIGKATIVGHRNASTPIWEYRGTRFYQARKKTFQHGPQWVREDVGPDITARTKAGAMARIDRNLDT